MCILLASITCASLFYGGGARDTLVATVLGCISAVLYYIAAEVPAFAPLFSIVAATVVSFVARLFQVYVYEHTCFYAVSLSALIWLLPGWSITTSVIEFAARSMISGTVRFMNALFTTLQLGFGLAVGSRLVFWVSGPVNSTCIADVHPAWQALTFPVMSIAFNILLVAHPRQWPGMTLSALVSVVLSTYLPQIIPNGESPPPARLALFISVGAYSRLLLPYPRPSLPLRMPPQTLW